MNQIEYITIAEFATRAGVTKQAIYQRLNKDLTKYVKVVDSRKMIDISALEAFTVKQVEQVNSKEVDNDLTSALTTLNSVIDALNNQLEVKDKQIQNLTDRLRQEQENNAQALTNQSQSHYLIAAGSEQVKNQEPESVELNPEQDPGEVKAKRGWLHRAFRGSQR